MKSLVFLWLIGFGVSSNHQSAAQSVPMSAGVSVKMAETTSAAPYRDADAPVSWVVTITADGHLFFGSKPVTADSLVQQMQATPRSQTGKLYVKADSRAPFSLVKLVLNAGQTSSFDTAVLLTAQSGPAGGKFVPSMGLDIRLGSPTSPAAIVRLRHTGQSTPALRINNQDLPWSRLPVLKDLLHEENQKMVSLEADGKLPFDPIVTVIDFCRSLGVEVALSLSGM